jgi:hypothetical protein
MEFSILYIAVVFLLPFALGFMLLGTMVADADRASRPVSQPPTAAPAKVPAAKVRVDGNIGHCVPA